MGELHKKNEERLIFPEGTKSVQETGVRILRHHSARSAGGVVPKDGLLYSCVFPWHSRWVARYSSRLAHMRRSFRRYSFRA